MKLTEPQQRVLDLIKQGEGSAKELSRKTVQALIDRRLITEEHKPA